MDIRFGYFVEYFKDVEGNYRIQVFSRRGNEGAASEDLALIREFSALNTELENLNCEIPMLDSRVKRLERERIDLEKRLQSITNSQK